MLGANLKKLRKAEGLTQMELAKALNVGASTLAMWESAGREPDIDTLIRIADFFNVSLDELVGRPKISEDLSRQEIESIKKYRTLDEYGKRAVYTLLEIEGSRQKTEKKRRVIPFIGNAFAAGTGEPDFSNMVGEYETDSTAADFAFLVNGDSMEPYLPDGSVQLGIARQPKDGECAVLLIDGEFLVKQIAVDPFGNMYLFSLNRDRQDADRVLWSKDEHSVYCFGTVITEKVRLPRV